MVEAGQLKTNERKMEVITKELAPIKVEVTELSVLAETAVITTPEENATAMELKAKLKALGKQIKDRKEAITKPLNVALKSARELFAPLEEKFERADELVGEKLLAYKKQVDAEAKAEEAKIAARLDKGTIKLETAERKIAEIETVQKTSQTEHGQVQFRKLKKVRIKDKSKIPDKYWVVDEVALRKDALAIGALGEVIPGAEVYEEETV